MASKKEQDITKTGPIGLRGIRNSDLYNNLSSLSAEGDDRATRILSSLATGKSTPFDGGNNLGYYTPQEVQDSPFAKLGESTYDEPYMINADPTDIDEHRAYEQSGLIQLTNGILKAGTTAATTIIDGTVGLLYGIGQGIVDAVNAEDGQGLQAFGNALFNNDISKTLRGFTETMEEVLPNYRTQDELENPYALRNLLSVNTIADDFLKNMGFTVGAFYSGNAFLGALRATKAAGLMSSMAAKTIGSVVSGVNEGRIEAGNMYDEMMQAETGQAEGAMVAQQEELEAKYRTLYENIMSEPDTLVKDPETGRAISSKQLKLQQLQQQLQEERIQLESNWEKTKDNIQNRAEKAAIADLILNSIYLPAENAFAYGKLYARKFKPRADLASRTGKKAIDAAAEAEAKETIGGRILREGKEFVANPESKKKAIGKGLLIGAGEGFEEGMQSQFAATSTAYFAPDSPDAYYLSLQDPDYQIQSKDLMTAMAEGFNNSWGGEDVWKEVGIGFLTGIIGMPTFGKVNNSNHNTYLGRNKTIGLSGGLFGNMAESSYLNEQAELQVGKMNDLVKKVDSADRFFVRNQAFTDAMDGYVEDDDRFEFENASDNETFNLINSFGETGRVQDLMDLIDEDFENISDEELKDIAENTTTNKQEWKNPDGSSMADTPMGREKMRETLKENRDKLKKSVLNYMDALDETQRIGQGILNDDQKSELAWLLWKQKMFTERFGDIKKSQTYEDSDGAKKNFITTLRNSVGEFINSYSKEAAYATPDIDSEYSIEQYQKDKKWVNDKLAEVDSMDEKDLAEFQDKAAKVNAHSYYEEILFEEHGLSEEEKVEKRKSRKSYGERLAEDREARANILGNMKVVQAFLNAMERAKTPLQLGSLVESNPQIVKYLQDIGFDMLSDQESMDVSPTDFNKFMKSLQDAAKISVAAKQFHERYQEFAEDPTKLLENRAKVDKKVSKNVQQKKQSALVKRFNWNGSTKEILATLEENSKDIQDMGGMNAFLNSLDDSQREKIKKAQRLKRTLTGATRLIEDDENFSDLEKRILSEVLVQQELADGAELADKLQEQLNNGTIAQALLSALDKMEVFDKQKVDMVENMEVKVRKFIEEKLPSLTQSVEQQQQAEDAEEARQQQALKHVPTEDKEQPRADSAPKEDTKNPPKEGGTTPLTPPQEDGKGPTGAPKEGPQGPTGKGPKDTGSIIPPTDIPPANPTDDEVRKTNKKAPSGVKRGVDNPMYNQTPQMTETYLHGYNGISYIEYVEEEERKGRDVTPDGVDKKAFKQYVKAVHEYLKKAGAFDYVRGIREDKLKTGDAIEFTIDEELNQKAGVPVVLMQVTLPNGQKQIIGSLPTSLDFDSRTKYNENGQLKVSSKTTGQRKPEVKALVDFILEEYDRYKQKDLPKLEAIANATTEEEATKAMEKALGVGIPSSVVTPLYMEVRRAISENSASKPKPHFVSSQTSKVKELLGGNLNLSTMNSTVAEIFDGTNDVPVIAIVNEDGQVSRFQGEKSDLPLSSPEAAVRGQVYLMIPTNKGTYLPALCSSMRLSELSNEDEYIKRIVAFISSIPNILDKSQANNLLYKWLPVRSNKFDASISIRIGEYKDGKFVETDRVSATTMQINYTNPKNPDGAPIRVNFKMEEGKVTEQPDAIVGKVRGIINSYPDMTTNVDINKLGNSEEDIEYRQFISQYLRTNIVKGSTHTINDWFRYDRTSVERDYVLSQGKGASPRENAKGTPMNTTQEVGGQTFTIQNGEVRDGEGNPVDDATRQAVVEGSKPAGIEVPEEKSSKPSGVAGMFANIPGATIGTKKGAPVIPRRRHLLVSDTSEQSVPIETAQKAIDKVKELFPSLSESDRVVIVQGLIHTIDSNGKPVEAYGEFRDGVLYISDQAPKGTAYHEAFHYIADTLLSEEEKVNMFKAAKEKYGDLSEIALEEKLAEDFREFMNGYDNPYIPNFLRTLFHKLKTIVKAIAGKPVYIDNLFYDLYKGRYSGRSEENTFKDDLLKYKNSKYSYNNLDNDTKEYLQLRGISQEDYEKLPVRGKEDLLHCM